MNVLVVGAQGQLGHALQEELRTRQVTAYDIEHIDITNCADTNRVIAHVKPDVVINVAAYTNVDQAESDPDTAYRVNALGPRNLALATESLDIPIVHVSTDYVFDGRQEVPYHEFDRPNPCSIYGKSKLAGEEIVRATTKRHFIVRTAWLYHTIGKNFPKTIYGLAQQSEVRVVRDQFGSPTYAPHLAKAINLLLETEAYGTFHFAGAGGTSWYGFTQELFKQLNVQSEVIPVTTLEFPRPAPRPVYAILTTLQDPLITLPPWKEGVAAFAQEFKKQASDDHVSHH